jgi:hypothetical protein
MKITDDLLSHLDSIATREEPEEVDQDAEDEIADGRAEWQADRDEARELYGE